MKKILKSIGAIIGGFLVAAVLSIGTDLILEKMGIMTMTPFDANPSWLILIVVLYRCIFNTLGAYATACLAPSKPMIHVLWLGGIGMVLSAIGTIVMWDVPPHWYPIVITLSSLPLAWLGGRLRVRK